MAKTILRDAVITINGVDLSDHASSVTINDPNDDVDLTAFGAQSKVHGVGLGDPSIGFDFFQDFEAGSVHATLSAIKAGKTPVPVVVKPTAAATSATNPAITMQGLLMDYSPLDGSVGEASTMSVEFTNGADAGLTYVTA